MSNNKKKNKSRFPFVSVCTPTFNRRPFIKYMIKCFEHQTYPRDKMEWIIIDDGTDKIEDLVKDVPGVKYFKYDVKMTLGKKRNIMHYKSSGDIIIYMDDDDYYPPERVSHAVETLQENPKALCAGTSEMHCYFKHIQKLYQFGPYGPNHSTAATFAFRRELLSQTKYDETACLAEEKAFLKNYTIPFVQLNPTKSILVISHNHNSFDKKHILNEPNQYVNESKLSVSDFMKEPELIKFYMEDVDTLLEDYEPGLPIHKKDVIEQTEKLKQEREKLMLDQQNALFFKMELEMREKMRVYAENLKDHYEKMFDDKTRLVNEVLKRNRELMLKNSELEKQLELLKSNNDWVNITDDTIQK
jgi:glycosyltransferase involved in cell wall biosynthesis